MSSTGSAPSSSDLVNNLVDSITNGSNDDANDLPATVGPNDPVPSSTEPSENTTTPSPVITPIPSTTAVEVTPGPTSVRSAADASSTSATQGSSSSSTSLAVSLVFGALILVIGSVYLVRARKRRREAAYAYQTNPAAASNNQFNGAHGAAREDYDDPDLSIELPQPPPKERVSIFSDGRYASEDSVFQTTNAVISPRNCAANRKLSSHQEHPCNESFEYRPSENPDIRVNSSQHNASNNRPTPTRLSDASPDASSVFVTTSANAKLLRVIQAEASHSIQAGSSKYYGPAPRDTATSVNSLHDSICGDWSRLKRKNRVNTSVDSLDNISEEHAHSDPLLSTTNSVDSLDSDACSTDTHADTAGAQPPPIPIFSAGMHLPPRRPPLPPPPSAPAHSKARATTEFRLSQDFPATSRDTVKRSSEMSTASTDSSGNARAGSLIECISVQQPGKDGKSGREIEI